MVAIQDTENVKRGRPAGATRRNRSELPEGRRKIWAGIRLLRQFDFDELGEVTEVSYPHMRRYVRRLLGAGYLRLVEEAKGAETVNRYLLVRDSGPEPPIPRHNTQDVWDPNLDKEFAESFGQTARDRAWHLIREGLPFSRADLETEGLQKANAFKYLACLLEAGVICQTRFRKPGPNGWAAEYQIIRDLGEKAPVEQRQGGLFDPNSGEYL